MEVQPKEILQLIYYESQYYFGIIGEDAKAKVSKAEAITFVYPGGAV
jgi:hypothetical protein